jgi:histidyl-tRNA synthetase
MASQSSSLSGFPEYLPRQQLYFNQLRDVIINTFESVGYAPMETPAVEKIATLLSKGGIDQEVYAVKRYQDQQSSREAELALRFDLTVPLARYVAQHYSDLVFPFRRYQIAPVWRGERAQAGRYRQFYQCDIDIIGEESLSLEHDIEVLMVLKKTLVKMGLKDFTISINHKLILTGFLDKIGIVDELTMTHVLRIIDKKNKISRETLAEELQTYVTQEQLAAILDLLDWKGTQDELFVYLKSLSQGYQLLTQGVVELELLLSLAKVFNCSDVLKVDLTLARGLAYYTGIIFETTLKDFPQLGSIASGGRYDNLAEKFSKKRLPGVGMSIGLSRLFAAFLELNQFSTQASPASVLIAVQEQNLLSEYVNLAEFLRTEGIAVEVYLERKKLAQQFKYADKKNIPFVITANTEEIKEHIWVLRNLNEHQEQRLSREHLLEYFKN